MNNVFQTVEDMQVVTYETENFRATRTVGFGNSRFVSEQDPITGRYGRGHQEVLLNGKWVPAGTILSPDPQTSLYRRR